MKAAMYVGLNGVSMAKISKNGSWRKASWLSSSSFVENSIESGGCGGEMQLANRRHYCGVSAVKYILLWLAIQ